MQFSIELRRRSGEGLIKPTDDGPSSSVLENRGAAGFGLSNNDDAAAARRSQAQQQQQQQQRRRQRRRRVFLAAAALLSLLALLFASSRRGGRGTPRNGQGASSSPPPPSASCLPADASTRLAFFRGRLGGVSSSFPSFPTTATGFSPERGEEEEGEGKGRESEARELIDQGWLLYRGFHRAAAAAAFSAALELSPRGSSSSAAAAALGLAWSLGPGANMVAVDDPVPWPAFEARRDFPLAAEAAAKAVRLAEEAEEKLEEEEKAEGDDGDDDGDEGSSGRLRLRRRFSVQRDLALARIAAARFAPGTSSGRARERAEAEAAVEMEAAARRWTFTPFSSSSSSSPPLSADPSLLALAAELRIHEGQWDYWHLPEGQANADSDPGVVSFLDDETGWPVASPFLTMKPHAAAAAALVKEALSLDPLEPLALHLAVHLSEAAPPSQAAAMGLAAADALAGIVRGGGGKEGEEEERVLPGRRALEAAAAADAVADGTALLLPKASTTTTGEAAPWISAGIPHLLHMPVHLFTRAGLYSDAVSSGLVASHADDAMASSCIESYAVEHNAAALVFAANLSGKKKISEIQVARLARSQDLLGPALAYAEGTVEVTLGISTEVLFADWGAIRKRRLREAGAALEAEVQEEGERKRRRRWWRSLSSSPPSSSSSSPPSSPSNERGLCVAGGAEFSAAMKAAASALELATAAEKLGGGGGGGGDSSLLLPEEAAVKRAEELALSLAPEPQTRPGGGPGIYACGHAEVAGGFAALARARLLLAKGSENGDGERAAAKAAAEVLEKHELLQFRSPYIEPPRSQLPLAPCLGYLLLKSGDFDAAAGVFRRDLAARPANGRGLLGLALALEGLSSSTSSNENETERQRLLAATARKTRGAFEAAWRGADATLSSPCPALSD